MVQAAVSANPAACSARFFRRLAELLLRAVPSMKVIITGGIALVVMLALIVAVLAFIERPPPTK